MRLKSDGSDIFILVYEFLLYVTLEISSTGNNSLKYLVLKNFLKSAPFNYN